MSRLVMTAALAFMCVIVLTADAHAELLEKTKKVSGTTVHYKVVLPNGYDPAKEYPAILAFGGGPQTMNTVDGILMRNFRAEAEKRGYEVGPVPGEEMEKLAREVMAQPPAVLERMKKVLGN